MLDFIDLGCSQGSIEYSKKIFGGKEHLGINIVPSIVEECCEKGYNVIQGDITDLKIELPQCRYITSLHVLEHLQDTQKVSDLIKLASKTATDFLYFSIPNFDDDIFLKSIGLKFAWSDYLGHKTKLTTDMFKEIVDNLNLTTRFGKSILVNDSSNKEILPVSAPIDTIYYDESFGEKKFFKFNDIYRENYAFVRLRDIDYWKKITTTKLW